MIGAVPQSPGIIYEALLKFRPPSSITCNGNPLLAADSQRDVSHGVVTIIVVIIVTIIIIVIAIAFECGLGGGRGCSLYVVAYIVAPSRLWSPWASPRVESGI